MRVDVNLSVCQGHTQCNFVAPEVFGLRDDDGQAYVLVDPVPADLEDQARLAEASCPEQAIVITPS
jgi:ferredoxin